MKAVHPHLRVSSLAAAIALSCACAASAQTFPNWVSPTSATIGTSNAAQKARVIMATAFLVQVSQIGPALEPGYYRMTAQPANLNSYNGFPVVTNTQFYGEPRMAPQGRSGYLVAPDIIATASHGYFDQNSYAIVFDMRPVFNDLTNQWDPPNFDRIPADKIIFPPHGPIIADFPDFIPPGVGDSRYDFAAFRLAAPRTDRQYLRLRRSGAPSKSDAYMLAAYPEQLSLRVSKDVGYLGDVVVPAPNLPPVTLPRFTNYVTVQGSSGGPVYNLTRGLVETSVGTTGTGCMKLTPGSTGAPNVASNVCPETAGGAAAQNTVNMGPIQLFAQHVPAAELLVSPLEDTRVQMIPLGGTPAVTSFTYTLKVDPNAPASVMYDAMVEPPPLPGQPALLSMTPSAGTLPVGGSITKTATLSGSAIMSCGVYEQTLRFSDTTHVFNDRLTHRIEAGLTDYTIEALGPTLFQGIASPYLPAQVQFRIANPRPTPISVKVSNGTRWLRLDGQPVPVSGTHDVIYNLAAKGSPGDSAVATLTIDTTYADALPSNEHIANLTFTNLNTCQNPATNAIRIETVTLDKRQLLLTTDVLDTLPDVSPAQALVSTVGNGALFCVRDIDFKADFIASQSPFGNTAFLPWVPDLELYLTNPAGTRVRIWQHQTSQDPAWPYENGSYDGVDTRVIHLKSTESASLAQFVNLATSGNWTLEAIDGFANNRRGFLTDWQLVLKGSPGACPP